MRPASCRSRLQQMTLRLYSSLGLLCPYSLKNGSEALFVLFAHARDMRRFWVMLLAGQATNLRSLGKVDVACSSRATEDRIAMRAVRGPGCSVAQASVQSSTSRSGTRRNSRVLLVTSVTPMLTAWAAIRVSSGPIGVPAFSRATLTRP